MLVLSRRIGERIQIGDDVWVTVLHSTGGRVKLGIDAPREVPVTRDDHRDPVHRERSTAPTGDRKPARSPSLPTA